MGVYVGTWVYDSAAGQGDTVKALRLDWRDRQDRPWGTAVGLGWTPTLQVRLRDDVNVYANVTGSWEDATESAMLFMLGTASALVPASGSTNYEALLVMTYAGGRSLLASDDESDTFDFQIRRWP
jgi:hypothetical protein